MQLISAFDVTVNLTRTGFQERENVHCVVAVASLNRIGEAIETVREYCKNNSTIKEFTILSAKARGAMQEVIGGDSLTFLATSYLDKLNEKHD